MAANETKPTSSPNPEARPQEVSLDDIDRILKESDPEFATQLTEISAVGATPEVEIESAVEGESELVVDEGDPKKVSWLERHPRVEKLLAPVFRLKLSLKARWMQWRTQLIMWARQLWILARTLPGEFGRYLKSMGSISRTKTKAAAATFRGLSRAQKILWFSLLAMAGGLVFVIKMNLMGVWLPHLFPHIVNDLTEQADQVWEVTDDTKWVSLYRAFPQEEIEFLFPKIIVNLRASRENRNPMGIFEVYVVLDSQDAALEVKAREKELHDHLQRAVESQTYTDLSSPLGKKRVKDLLRKELNDILTQGWAKDVLIKTMVLKP